MDLEQVKAQDIILRHLDSALRESFIGVGTISIELELDYLLCHACCSEMESKEHAETSEIGIATQPFPDDFLVMVTAPGRRFLQQGNTYEEEYNIQLAEAKRIEVNKKIEEHKLKWDSQVSKFQAKTKWLPLILAGISLIVAIWAIIKPQSEIEELKLELKKIKDTISILFHTKTDDSESK